MTDLSTLDLDGLRKKVQELASTVNSHSYSGNMIGLILSEIDSRFGEPEAQKAIKDFGLDKKGW